MAMRFLCLCFWVVLAASFGTSFILSGSHSKVMFLSPAVPSTALRMVDSQVFDDVLSTGDCSTLSGFLTGKAPGFKVFDRRDMGSASELERLLDSVLCRLSDDSRWVEYWHVTRWISHDFHRDVDEQSCFQQGIQRHPRNGHVLYVSLDPVVAATGGHTCVLSEDKSKMYVCPPLPGRLLRFNGTLLHGVPRPGLEYFLNAQSSDEIASLPVIESLLNQDWPSLQNLAASSESSSETLGRVNLLFNTWPDQPPTAPDSGDVQTELLEKGIRCSQQAWESNPQPFIPEKTNLAEEKTNPPPPLRMLIGLPADRRRRDSYETSIKLQSGRMAPEAFVIPPAGNVAPPRVINTVSSCDEEE